ncbi:MAG: hypothetical protein H7326_08770 [Bdellovibrionaceae bacterium]|nr:hypothetical protein [Pseudobdellovibrionaceae bacterium]
MSIRNTRGQSLIQVLVAMAISVIVLMTTMTVIQTQTRETLALQQKLGAIGLETSLFRAVSDGAVCKKLVTTPTNWVFNGGAIGTAVAPTLTMDSIPSSSSVSAETLIQVGKTASVWTTSLVVSSISLTDISGNGNDYSGRLKVEFDLTKLIRALKPISIRIDFRTQPASPLDAKVVTDCSTLRDEIVICGFYQYYMQCGNEDGNCLNATPAWTCGNGVGKTAFGRLARTLVDT